MQTLLTELNAQDHTSTMNPASGCRYDVSAVQYLLLSVDKADDFLTKDMGEDRWLCTLLVQEGSSCYLSLFLRVLLVILRFRLSQMPCMPVSYSTVTQDGVWTTRPQLVITPTARMTSTSFSSNAGQFCSVTDRYSVPFACPSLRNDCRLYLCICSCVSRQPVYTSACLPARPACLPA